MPKLPEFSKALSDEKISPSLSENSKDDLLLLFLSICYNNQKNNSFAVYNFLFSFAEKLLPNTYPSWYAKFHYALLHPPKNIEETLTCFIKIFPEKERHSLLFHLETSGFFDSEHNKRLFSLVRSPVSNSSHWKKMLQDVFQFPKEQLHGLSVQVKKLPNPFKNRSSQELNHPSAAYQQSLHEYFSEFYQLLNADPALQQEIEEFLSTLQNQSYHLVVTGEGKRGKSSLINALLQNPISVVEESVPKTAVPVEFYFSEHEEFYVQFLEEKELTIQKNSEKQQGLFFLQHQNEQFSCGTRIKIPKNELNDYADTAGKHAHKTAKVYIGINNPLLKQGFHLIDTPGFNCVNPFHDYLTYKECLQADCIVFAADARKPDSATELNFLREITAKGRVISLIGILTNADRLNRQENIAKSLERAQTMFREIAAQNSQIEFLGLYALNPRELMDHFCRRKHLSKEQHAAWEQFLSSVEKAVKNSGNVRDYQQKIHTNAQNLLTKIQNFADSEHKGNIISYPANLTNILTNHKEALLLALEKYRNQALQLTQSVEKDIENWQKNQEQALEAFEQEFITALQLKAHEFADMLGPGIAKNDKWKEFDQNIAKQTAGEKVKFFIEKQEEQLAQWEEKIKIFHKNMHILSNECLETISLTVNSMGSTSIENTTLNNILVQGNLKMKQLSLFIAGASSGFILSASFFNLMTVGSIALAFLGDPISISGLLLTGIGAVTLHFQGDLQKHKTIILRRKQKKIEEWAKKVRLALTEAIQEKQTELYEQYRQVIQQSFLPSFELLFSEAVHIHWYLEFIRQLQKNETAEYEKTRQLTENTKKFLAEKPL